MAPEKLHWKHLFDEVVTSGLCTGCAGCVVACPHDVLGYKDTEGVYKPFHLEEEGGPGGCGHGERGCTSCTRACPRFRAWEPEIDQFMFGRSRSAIEVEGITKDVILTRASDDIMHTKARLLALSPAATLGRGYAIVQSADGAVVRAAADISAGQRLTVRFTEDQLNVIADNE